MADVNGSLSDGGTDVRCPVCGQKFAVQASFDGLEFDYRESDLRPVFTGGPDPFASLIQVCPNCRFAAYIETFGYRSSSLDWIVEMSVGTIGDRPLPIWTLPSKPDKKTRDSLSSVLTTMLKDSTVPSPAMNYLLAARCQDFFLGPNPSRVVDYFLRGLWAARALHQTAVERAFSSATLERLRDLALSPQIPEGDRFRFAYLQAEFARRSGDFLTAINVFSQIQDAKFETTATWAEEASFFCIQSSRLLAMASSRLSRPARLWDLSDALASEFSEGDDEFHDSPLDGPDADGMDGLLHRPNDKPLKN